MICEHLRTRDTNPGIFAALDTRLRSRQSAIESIQQQLVSGTYTEGVVCESIPLRTHQCPEGRMGLGEEWVYPSADLWMCCDRFGIYDPNWGFPPPPAPFPLPWQVHIGVGLEDHGQVLSVVIPLTPPWCEPRWMARQLTRLGTQAGQLPKGFSQQRYREEYRDLDVNAGVWRMRVDDETSPEEVLTCLVIGALKREFHVGDDDAQAAWQWVHRVVWGSFRRWAVDEALCEQWAREMEGPVFQRLIEQFELPRTAFSLRGYIQATAHWFKWDELKKHSHGYLSPLVDPATDEVVYPPAWVAQTLGVTTRTVYEWMKKYRFTETLHGRKVLSEEQLAFLDHIYRPKRQRKELMQYLTNTKGKQEATAKQWIRRRKNKGKSVADMTRELLPGDVEEALGDK